MYFTTESEGQQKKTKNSENCRDRVYNVKYVLKSMSGSLVGGANIDYILLFTVEIEVRMAGIRGPPALGTTLGLRVLRDPLLQYRNR